MKYETKQRLNEAVENWANANFSRLFPEDEDYKRIWKTRNNPKNQLRSDVIGALMSDRRVSKILADNVGKEDFGEMTNAVVERFFDLIEAAFDA